MAKSKPAARTATDPNAALLDNMRKSVEERSEKPTNGVRKGLRDGELRVTCILGEQQNEVLHDWAKLSGRTFREVCISMADHYIADVIGQFVKDGNKLRTRKEGAEPPSDYVDLYEESKPSDDKFAQYF